MCCIVIYYTDTIVIIVTPEDIVPGNFGSQLLPIFRHRLDLYTCISAS